VSEWIEGRQVVVTGATGGIGLATACELARRGARLALLGRDPARSEAAREAVRAAAPGAEVRLFRADLGVQADVRRVADELLAALPRIDVLVNNAGVAHTRRQLTPDGVEATLAVNHLAYFLLTNLLLERLRAAGDARIVSVASDAHRFVRDMAWDDLELEHGYGFRRAYGQSKLANILFTRALARRLEGSGVTANCLHPGAVGTGLGTNNGWLGPLVMTVLRPFFKTPEQGAETSVHLACADEVRGRSGGYYARCRPVEPTAAARSDAGAERLWAWSAERTGLAA